MWWCSREAGVCFYRARGVGRRERTVRWRGEVSRAVEGRRRTARRRCSSRAELDDGECGAADRDGRGWALVRGEVSGGRGETTGISLML